MGESEPKRWRIPSTPVDDAELSADERWLRRFDKRVVRCAGRHPQVWRSDLERKVHNDDSVWSEAAEVIPRDAVLALTLRLQEWLVDHPAGLTDARARKTLRALWKLVTDTEEAPIEVLKTLDAIVEEEPDDRLRVLRASLVKMFGAGARAIDDSVLANATTAWTPPRRGAPTHKRWDAVVALLHALGLRHVRGPTIARYWRRKKRS